LTQSNIRQNVLSQIDIPLVYIETGRCQMVSLSEAFVCLRAIPQVRIIGFARSEVWTNRTQSV